MELIKEWREAWKLTSVQTALLIAALSGLYAAFPVFAEHISPVLYASCMVFLSLALVVLRLIKQDLGQDG